MVYLKSYLKAFKDSFVGFSIIFLIISLLQWKNGLAILCLYYSVMVGFAGPLSVVLNKEEKKKCKK